MVRDTPPADNKFPPHRYPHQRWRRRPDIGTAGPATNVDDAGLRRRQTASLASAYQLHRSRRCPECSPTLAQRSRSGPPSLIGDIDLAHELAPGHEWLAIDANTYRTVAHHGPFALRATVASYGAELLRRTPAVSCYLVPPTLFHSAPHLQGSLPHSTCRLSTGSMPQGSVATLRTLCERWTTTSLCPSRSIWEHRRFSEVVD